MLEVSIVLATSALLAWPLGRHLARVLLGAPSRLDRVLLPVEGIAWRAIGTDPSRGMTWRGYAKAFAWSNVVLGVGAVALFMAQGALPLNPDGVGGMRWDLSLHTAISFLTNTNQQHYSGQAQLSTLSQLAGIVTLQVVTPLMGLCIAAAVLRGLVGGRNAATAAEGAPRDVGNYWADLVRLTTRVMLPLGVVLALVLAWQGVPATLAGAAHASTQDDYAGRAEQVIPRGPVAPMVAVKQLGTNGGGWYGPNSAMPLENPTPLSNALQMLAIILLPMACAFMVGPLTGRRRLGVFVFSVMAVMSIGGIALAIPPELQQNAAARGVVAAGPNLEGKEVRFGAASSAAWSALTTQTSNGSVDAMHDSLSPQTALVAFGGMLVNSIWGGIGCGLVNFLVYLLLTLFLCGLMIGRTPEIFGRKLEVREVRMLAILVVLQPLAILGFTAVTVVLPGIAGTSSPGFHGLSQVLYEYASAFANNGSGLEGLGDGTPWWNLSCAVVLLLGRYPALLIPLAVAGVLASKKTAPESGGTLRVEAVTFGATLIAVKVVLTVLQFLPALALGPVAEAMQLAGAR